MGSVFWGQGISSRAAQPSLLSVFENNAGMKLQESASLYIAKKTKDIFNIRSSDL